MRSTHQPKRLSPVVVGAVVGLAALLGGCVSTTGAVSTTPGGRTEAPTSYVIETTESDATVSSSLMPVVWSAGPSSLFVASTGVRCPEGMALIGDRVCVDRWEASIVRTEAGKEATWSPFRALDGLDGGFRATTKSGVTPQGYISGHQAERACRAAGKRLCTASEWELGCRGPKSTQFPYGNDRRAKVCNDDVRARHPVIEATNQAGIFGDKVWLDGMNLPAINQLPDTLLPTGSREDCVTAEGLYDMVGNLHEWVAEADGTFRGGYYMDTTQNGDGCSYQTTAHDFDYHDYSTGFRCCADPESVE